MKRKRLTIFGLLIAGALATTAIAFGQEHHAADPHSSARAESAEAHEEHSMAGHEASHHGPEAINWTDIDDRHRPAYIALVINFGVLVVGYYLLGKKPVSDALKQRRTTIGKAIEDAQAMLGEAKERAKKYQADLKNADADAADAKAALVAAGKGEVERLLTDANEKAERMKRDADRLVDQERKQVQHDLHRETIELAVKEAAKTLEKTVTAEDHARLAEDLLKELSARPAAARGHA
jgi:F-type H+-transporting ATPase subunit b